jgi:hypothetical protein
VRSENAEIFLRVANGIRVWQWFALEMVDGDSDPPEHFAWRSASDGPLPVAWLSDARAEGATVRVWVPLDAALTNGLSQSLALVDDETGWALVGEARVEARAELVR